ncbi:hypothetical protein J7E63_27555 [Bacillus sp. ISL-75]|nr:hypothetical protein [Bacillus sp. ISL-75]MBT2730583.1 hypothetical protein [Bacillus sp. ISL-75]
MADKKDQLTIHEKWEIDSKQGIKTEKGPEAREAEETGALLEIEDRSK